MGSARKWPWVVFGVVLLAAGIFTMGTEVGNAQWIIGLILVVIAAVLLFRVAMTARRSRSG